MTSDVKENGSIKLNEDFLAELEEAAKGRYTEEDEAFMKVFNTPEPRPPIQPAEQFNRNRHGGRFRGNRHRGGGYRDNWQDRRPSNYRGGGGGGYRDDRYGYGSGDRQGRGGYSGKRSWDDNRQYRH